VSKEDREFETIVAVDCSWKRFEGFRFDHRFRRRRLPTLLAGNPGRYAQPVRLSTAEALAATLHILDRPEAAREVLAPFGFADAFWTLNEEPLDAYRMAVDREGVLREEDAFFPRQEDGDRS